MKHSDDIGELTQALVAFQAEVKDPVKTRTADIHSERTGKTFTYKYVDLADVLEATRPALKAHGLAIAQELITDNAGQVGATTLIMHTSGQYLTCGPVFVPAGDDARDAGKAATYARRYSLLAALNLAAADDDAATTPPRRQGASDSNAATKRQLGKIHVEAKACGITDEQLRNALKRDYSVASEDELTKDQAGQLIERLVERHRALDAEKSAPANVDPVSGEVDDDAVPGMDGDAYRTATDAKTAAGAQPTEKIEF